MKLTRLIVFFVNSILYGKYVSTKIMLPRHYKFDRVKISSNVVLGDFISIADNTQLLAGSSKIFIGQKVSIGPNVLIQNYTHDTYSLITSHFYLSHINELNKNTLKSAEIVIGDNVWIGANVVILPGVKIGENSIIGANTVIGRDIPPNSIVTHQRELKIVQRSYS